MRTKNRYLIIVAALIAIGFALFVYAIPKARDAALAMSCLNNIRQAGLALLNHESAVKRFPTAIELREGKPWCSWRTHVYRYIESTPQFYDDSMSWDSPKNLRLLNGTPIPWKGNDGKDREPTPLPRVPHCFACPKIGSQTAQGVNYVVVRGESTAFPSTGHVRLADITDGPENTILVVESVTCTRDWTEPRDLDIETMKFRVNAMDGPSISSTHPRGAHVSFADGAAYLMTTEISEMELRALLTIAGNEPVTRSELIERGVLVGY